MVPVVAVVVGHRIANDVLGDLEGAAIITQAHLVDVDLEEVGLHGQAAFRTGAPSRTWKTLWCCPSPSKTSS